VHTRSETRQVGVTVIVEMASIVVVLSTVWVVVLFWTAVELHIVRVVTRVTGGAVTVLQLDTVVLCST